MEIKLDSQTVVNKRTGEMAAPDEYLENLQAVEAEIQANDEEVKTAKAILKRLKDKHEELVARLRSGVREGKVLPLLEAEGEGDVEAGWDDADTGE